MAKPAESCLLGRCFLCPGGRRGHPRAPVLEQRRSPPPRGLAGRCVLVWCGLLRARAVPPARGRSVRASRRGVPQRRGGRRLPAPGLGGPPVAGGEPPARPPPDRGLRLPPEP